MTNNLLQLPVDILLNIIKKLKLSDLRNVMLTCKVFRDLIISDNTIWRSVCRDRLILHNCTVRSRANNLSWYNRCRISKNWCTGIYKCKTLVHLYTNYMPWMKFHNSEALMLSLGSELFCYPVEKRGLPNCSKPLWTLNVPIVKRNDVRTNDISRFVIQDNFLVCGNRDGCAAIYKVDDMRRKPQLLYHIQDCHEGGQVEVSAVELITNNDASFIITASNHSPHVEFWHANNNGHHIIDNIMKIPIDSGEGVRCLAMNSSKDKLATGLDGNSKPLLLDVNMGKLLMSAETTRNLKQAVRDIGWHSDNVIMYVTHSGTLHLIDIRTHEVVYDAKDPFESTLYCVRSDGNHAVVVGSSEYSRCVLYDARKCVNHVQIYFTQRRPSPVYCLDFDSTQLIAAVDRGISTLNFNVNPATTQQRDYSHVFQS